jgi:hypothetical protein
MSMKNFINRQSAMLGLGVVNAGLSAINAASVRPGVAIMTGLGAVSAVVFDQLRSVPQDDAEDEEDN